MSGQHVVVGRLAGVYGVKGWLRLASYTQPGENVFDYVPWRLLKTDGPVDVEPVDSRAHGKGFVVKLEGVDDRDAAAALVGTDVAVARELLPALGTGDYYWSDLIGLSVETVGGESLGRVERLIETGANDVLVVHGERERLIPYVRERVVRKVDLDAGCIVVEWDADF